MLESPRERSHPCLRAGRDDTHGVVSEECRNLGCVRAELVVGTPKRCPFLARNLQLQHAQRESVDEQHDVGTPSALVALNRVLIDCEELVPVWVLEVHEPGDVVSGLATIDSPFDRDSCCQELVDAPVLGKHIGALRTADRGDDLVDDRG